MDDCLMKKVVDGIDDQVAKLKEDLLNEESDKMKHPKYQTTLVDYDDQKI